MHFWFLNNTKCFLTYFSLQILVEFIMPFSKVNSTEVNCVEANTASNIKKTKNELYWENFRNDISVKVVTMDEEFAEEFLRYIHKKAPHEENERLRENRSASWIDASKKCTELILSMVETDIRNKFLDGLKMNSKTEQMLLKYDSAFIVWKKLLNIADDRNTHRSKQLRQMSQKFNENDERSSTLSWGKSLQMMARGSYITGNWLSNPDKKDLSEDIVALNTEIGILCALVLTITVPLFFEGHEHGESILMGWYTFFLSLASIIEAVAVLVCIRNIIIVQLCQKESLSLFVHRAHYELVLPVKLMIISVILILCAMVAYGFFRFSVSTSVMFLCCVITPCGFLIFRNACSGIRKLYEIQPWCMCFVTATSIEQVEKIDKEKNADCQAGKDTHTNAKINFEEFHAKGFIKSRGGSGSFMSLIGSFSKQLNNLD